MFVVTAFFDKTSGFIYWKCISLIFLGLCKNIYILKSKIASEAAFFSFFYDLKLGTYGNRRTQNLKVISMSLESQQVSLLSKTNIFLVNLFP